LILASAGFSCGSSSSFFFGSGSFFSGSAGAGSSFFSGSAGAGSAALGLASSTYKIKR
jgi:hypothetical protein